MASELELKFLHRTTKSLFIPYFSLGDPNYESSIDWAKALSQGGADILELGIPFSDPVADGPVIQRAFTRAFQNPFSMEKIFEITASIHKECPNLPLVYLTYYNPIYQFGQENFLKKAKESGVSGVIVPDLPFDSPENKELFQLAKKYDLNCIQLITPATSVKRMEKMKPVASGFIYYVTSYGVTGERKEFSQNLKDRLEQVRKVFSLPIACGFGISTPEQANFISEFADGVIIGSAIQKIIEKNGLEPAECKRELQEFASQIRQKMK